MDRTELPTPGTKVWVTSCNHYEDGHPEPRIVETRIVDPFRTSGVFHAGTPGQPLATYCCVNAWSLTDLSLIHISEPTRPY